MMRQKRGMIERSGVILCPTGVYSGGAGLGSFLLEPIEEGRASQIPAGYTLTDTVHVSVQTARLLEHVRDTYCSGGAQLTFSQVLNVFSTKTGRPGIWGLYRRGCFIAVFKKKLAAVP